MLYRFDDIELDLNSYELRRNGRTTPIRKTSFNVLCYLIKHRDRVVTKEELLEALWGDVHVNESAIAWYINDLRKAVGQKRSSRRPVETVHGRGYQFRSKVQIVETVSPVTAPPSSSSIGEINEPFVGRQEVMAHLTRAVENAVAGRGSVLMLRGEAGIGKTRCALELSRIVVHRGRSVWFGRCIETASRPPFWPWIQILRNAITELPDESAVRQEAVQLLSILVPQFEPNTAPRQKDQPQTTTEKFWLYDRLFSFLMSSCAAEPRTLVIDDIQWADEASLEFLCFIAPEVPERRIVLLVALRDYEEMDSRSVHSDCLLRYAHQIPLTGLSEDDVEKYMTQLGLFESNEALTRAFYLKTFGNPLFISETFRWLKWTTEKDQKALTASDIHRLDVPDSIRTLMLRRLGTVEQKTRDVLEAASVVGRSFELGLLSQITREETETLVVALDRAMDTGLITRASASRFRFSHDLICEVAYECLPSTTRADYHNRIANILRKRSDFDAVIGEVAFHLYKALPLSDFDATIACCQQAAARSERVYAHGDAAVFYRWALEAMSSSTTIDPRARTNTLVLLGRQERMSGDAVGSRKTISKALEMARTHRFFDIVAAIASVRRATFLSAHIPRPAVREALEEALEHVSDQDQSLRIRLLSQLAQTPPYSTDVNRSKETSQLALGLAKDLGDAESIRIALNATLYSFTGPDDIDALLKSAEQLLGLEKKGALTIPGVEALLARILAFIHCGKMSEAKAAIDVFGKMMSRLNRVEGEWFYQRLLAQRTFDEGQFDNAIQRFSKLTERAKFTGMYYFDVFYQIQQAYVMRACGATIEQVRNLCTQTIESFRSVPASLAEIIGLVVEMGYPDLVRDAYSRLIAQGLDFIPRNGMWLNTLCNLTLAAVAFDDRQRFKDLYERLSPYADFNTPDGIFLYDGSVAHYLGILASKLDSDATVMGYFEQAIDANQRMCFRPQLLRSQVVFAEWLKAKGEKSDANRLKALVNEALESAREMKMEPLLERARAVATNRVRPSPRPI